MSEPLLIKVGDNVIVENRASFQMAGYPYSGTVKQVFYQAGFVPCAVIETGEEDRPERIFDNDINTIRLAPQKGSDE